MLKVGQSLTCVPTFSLANALLIFVTTVEPPIMDTPKSGQPPYNGQTVLHPLP